MKYRSLPREVEAFQFRPSKKLPVGVYQYAGGEYYVVTVHGQDTQVRDGDYIVTEPDGVHHYPVKADIFERGYKPA